VAVPRRNGIAGQDSRQLKAREPRRKVMISARVRVAGIWGDACILDISTRGLLIQAAESPPRGTYLDIRRGQHAIVARVIWAEDRRFGVCTQDTLAVDAIIRQPDASTLQQAESAAAQPAADRRHSPRGTEVRHEASRILSRTIEFSVVALFAGSLAVVAYSTVSQALWRPLAQLSSTMTAN